MKILLGVTSSISVYKALDLTSQLRKQGHEIKVIMSANAMKMVDPIPFFTLSGNPVSYDMFKEKDYIAHISLADWADLCLVIPATANIIGKYACGICDDLLSTTLISLDIPVIMAPAMNVKMYNHPAVVQNIATLRSRGVHFIEPATGMLACGYEGKGKLPALDDIMRYLTPFLYPQPQLLAGKHVVVSAGGTMEDIDPVRYITNRSSGLMGLAFAQTALKMGARVTLVHTQLQGPLPTGLSRSLFVRSAQEMLDALDTLMNELDILVMSAAVADYRPREKAPDKIKKKSETLTIELIKNPDILKTLASKKKTEQIFIGFALETNDLIANAKRKMQEKKMDLVIANSPENFEKTTASIKLLSSDGRMEELNDLSKTILAERVYERLFS